MRGGWGIRRATPVNSFATPCGLYGPSTSATANAKCGARVRIARESCQAASRNWFPEFDEVRSQRPRRAGREKRTSASIPCSFLGRRLASDLRKDLKAATERNGKPQGECPKKQSSARQPQSLRHWEQVISGNT